MVDRIASLDHEVKSLRYEVARLRAVIETIRQQDETSVTPQNASNEKDDSAQGRSLLKSEVPPSPANSRQTNKSWYKTAKRWNTVLQMIGIPFAIGYAIVTYNQWSDSQANFKANERAWIKIQYGWPDDKEVATAYHPDWPVSGKAGLWNEGKSVITRYYGEGSFEILDAKTSPSLTLNNFHSSYIGGPMFPTEESDFPIELFDQQARLPRAFTQSEYDDLRSGKKYVAIYGYLAYADQFGVHWYQFCSWKSYTASRADFNSGECVGFNKTGDGTDLPFGKKYIR